MAEAERRAINTVIDRRGKLLGKEPRTNRQTFSDNDHAMVKAHVLSASMAADNNRTINAFFSAPAPLVAPAAAAAAAPVAAAPQ